MQRVLLGVDRISTFVGQAFSWLIVALTALMTWEIFSRRFFDSPHAWAFDAQIQLYGVLFMTAGAYTLAKQGMVRGDVLYGFLRPRVQAGVDLVLYVAFFLPGILALTYAGWTFAGDSWAIRERSTVMTNGPPLYWFKSVIPFAGALMFLQGSVEIARCLLCLRDGEWPSRKEDVVEVDVDKLKELVHVKDEDLAKLDDLVVQQQKEKAGDDGGAA